MNPGAIERANERLRQAAEGRTEPAAVDAALERARDQIEALAETAAQLEASLPAKVGERLDGDLLSERHARVDDLALLIDLITSGWKGVDERLARIEKTLGADEGAVVYRIEERRTGT
jgi:hypothetical protein